MFNVCTIDEAKQLIKEKFKPIQIDTEEVSLLNALNRILAVDITAKCDVPHFNRSTVDGYAVRSKDVMGASESMPSYLKIVDQVLMGQPCLRKLNSGEAIYVPTGGMLPEGADCVVMIEDTDVLNEGELFVYKKCAPKENVLFKGEDIKTNELVLSKGRKIKAQDLGVLSSIGYERIPVKRQLTFTVISTGDEIVSPKEEPQLGEIRDINTYTISGILKTLHHEVNEMVVIKDDYTLLKQTVETALEKSDVVLLSGGSSVGQKDYTTKLLEEIEPHSVFIHGIAIKPGKPTIFANTKGKLVFGLPGQPASAVIVFKTFIHHLEHVLLDTLEEITPYIEATLTKNVHSTPGRETFQMVQLINREDGIYAEPVFGKSGTITLIAKADGYIRIPHHFEGLRMNERVKVYKL